MNDYEMVVLFHPDLEIDLEKPLKKVEKIVKDQSGKITATDNWGKRKMAYSIKKEDHAIYVVYEIQLPPEAVAKVETNLNLTDEVLRYIVTKPVPKSEEDEEEKEKPAKKSEAKSEEKESKKEDSEKGEEE